jgi:Carboxypeptidase regulatory-like domain
MGDARRGHGIRWVVPVLLAAAGIVLLLILSAPPEVTVPVVPGERDRADDFRARPVPDLPVDDPRVFSRIEGRVTRNGQGVAAALTLGIYVDYPGHPLRRVRADSSGYFAFDGVPPGRHEISATGPDGLVVRRRVNVPAGVDPDFIEFTPPSGETAFRGRAVHVDGRPFSGEVELRRRYEADRLSAPTGPDGRFVFRGLPAERYSVSFRSGRSFEAQARSIELPRKLEVTFVVDDGARMLRGRVFDTASGKPVAGAAVEIGGNAPSLVYVVLRTTSDADGRFQVALPMADGRVEDLTVKAAGFRPWRLCGFVATEEVPIALEPSAKLTVRVVAADGGAPVPFVPVLANFRSLPDVDSSECLLTDRRGTVVFSSIPGDTVRLSVRGHGFITDPYAVTGEPRFLTLSPQEEREVTLCVVRSAVLRGSVTTADGDPVSEGRVSYRTAALSGECYLKEGGTFLLEHLLPGDFRLVPGRYGLTGGKVTGTLAPGEVRTVALELGAGAWFLLEVRGEDTGQPLSGVRVELSLGGRGRTDESGQVRIGPLRPDRMELKVSSEGYCGHRQMVGFAMGETTSLAVSLSRGLSLSGRVVLPDGRPAKGARVSLSGPGVESGRTLVVKEDGTFWFRGLGSGTFGVAAWMTDAEGRSHGAKGRVRPETTDTILRLKPVKKVVERVVQLVVTDAEGAIVDRADFEILTRDVDGEPIGGDDGEITGGRGELHLDPEVAEFILFVHGARRPSSVPLPLGAARFGPYPAGKDRIQVALPEALVVTGHVLDSSGRGRAGVEVTGSMTTWPDSEPNHRFPWYARTGADGSFRIPGLGAGMVMLEAEDREMVQPAPVVVPAGEQDVVIRLDTLTSATVTVRDPEGRPVHNADVNVWNQSLFERGDRDEPLRCSGQTNSKGCRLLTDLPATTPHTLIVRRYGGLAPVRIDGWLPRDTEITLRPGLLISGRILGTGAGSLWAHGAARGWGRVPVHDNREFREGGFAEGRVALVWLPAEVNGHDELLLPPRMIDWPVTWVEAGESGIVFRIPSR